MLCSFLQQCLSSVTVHLFARGAGVTGGYNRIVFINNDCAEVAPQAGTLVGTPLREVEEILVPVGSHSRKYDQPRY